MYLGNDSSYTYYAGTEQRHSRGNFLLLLSLKPYNPDHDFMTETRAVVRKVALAQCGHWMLGTARIAGKSYTVSGAYGAAGLTLDVDQKAYDLGVPVPRELMELWSKGGGWNSAGSEAPSLREWALNNLTKLQPKTR